MRRTEPDAELKLLLEDYGKGSGRWWEAYAAAPDRYKKAALPSTGRAADADDSFLAGAPVSKTSRWLERFARDQFELDAKRRSPSILTASESPELHLLLEDYRPAGAPGGPVPRNGLASPGHPAQPVSARSAGSSSATQPDRANNHALSASPEGRQLARKKAEPVATSAPAPETLTARTAAGDPADLDLTLHWDDLIDNVRRRKAQGWSLLIHAVWIAILLLLPHAVEPPLLELTLPNSDTVSLVAPSASQLAELTQQSPNPKEITKTFDGLTEPARPSTVIPPVPAVKPQQPVPLPEPPKLEMEPKAEPPAAPAPVIEETKPPGGTEIAEARSPAPGLTQQGENRPRLRPDELPMPRAPKTASKPKLEFENPTATGLGADGELQIGTVKLNPRPDEVMQSATESLIRGGGQQIVGDGYKGAGMGAALPPSPGNRGSTLELLSDPQGVDFRPYLIQVLAAVRRNWYPVIPESARLGMTRGRVAIQFIISREGEVPKLVIATSSDVRPLDQAAIAGISASIPFQPLPAEFTGKEIRLQFVFLYNIKSR